MINITELRIGNYIVNTIKKKIIEIIGISNEGFIEYFENEIRKKIDITNLEPLYLSDDLIDQLVNIGILLKDFDSKDIYYFAHSTSTYFFVNNKNEYFVGMIDTNLPEDYRRITRPFKEYHKLQNAYLAIYNKELLRFSIE